MYIICVEKNLTTAGRHELNPSYFSKVFKIGILMLGFVLFDVFHCDFLCIKWRAFHDLQRNRPQFSFFEIQILR